MQTFNFEAIPGRKAAIMQAQRKSHEQIMIGPVSPLSGCMRVTIGNLPDDMVKFRARVNTFLAVDDAYYGALERETRD